MPLFALFAAHVAVGLATALASAGVLRTSPRPLIALDAFRALAWHEVLVGMPVTALVVARAGDWAVSYLFDCAHLPSLVLALLVTACGLAGAGAFVLGVRLVRDHRAAWIPRALVAIAAVVVLLGVIARSRVVSLGSYVQHRGGFGLQPIADGTTLPLLGVLVLAWCVGAALLVRAGARATA